MTHDSQTTTPIVIGTRPSKLALWQAEHVKSLLETRFGLNVTLKKITTKGDQVLDRSLVAIGGKGLFLKEIEDDLLSGAVALAVHSMKDVPYDLPKGLVLAAILPREETSDAWIGRGNVRIADLPDGAVVGTTSLRRQVQLKQRFPKLIFKDLRGNVDTRLNKLDNGEFDGIVLATAGLKRLGLGARISERLDLVSAAGQGAIGIECRESDVELLKTLRQLNDDMTSRCVLIERTFLKKVEGSCQTPVGCHVQPSANDADHFEMRCFLAKPDGSNSWERSATGCWNEAEAVLAEILK